MGELKIRNAFLDTAQFAAKADADTFTLDVSNADFEFKPHAKARTIKVQLYKNARAGRGKGRLCISGGEMKVRLQGVDAPELSAVPDLGRFGNSRWITGEMRYEFNKYNEKCAQPLGTEARSALKRELGQRFGNRVQVEVSTKVGLPGDVFDTYGRFIGDVTAIKGRSRMEIGAWLARNGWAFPSYYESMTDEEIAAIDQAAGLARRARKNIWKIFSRALPPLVPNKKYMPASLPVGLLTLPKIFRRQITWWAESQAGLCKTGFYEYLASQGSTDEVFLKSDFLKNGRAAQEYHLIDFITPDGEFTAEPESLVFLESESRVFDPSGREILSWLPESKAGKPAWMAQAIPVGKRKKVYKDEIHWLNSVAVSKNGNRVVSCSYRYDYDHQAQIAGKYGVFCYDGGGKPAGQYCEDLWSGVFSTAVTPDGRLAAAGGWMDLQFGLLRAYDLTSGKRILDFQSIRARVSCVSFSEDGKILAAAADRVYVFRWSGKAFEEVAVPPVMSMGGYVTSVAVHPSGKWLAACSRSGKVLVADLGSGNSGITACDWQALGKSVNRTVAGAGISNLPFLCVQIAGSTETFAVGGGDFVYVCTRQGLIYQSQWKKSIGRLPQAKGMLLPLPTFPTEIDTWTTDAAVRKQPGARPGQTGPSAGGVMQNFRWLALSADGKRMAVLVNRMISRRKRGTLQLYSGNPLTKQWEVPLPSYPNCVSMNSDGSRIAVAYGYPEEKPGGFYLFDASGNELWHLPTKDMNWPVVISGDGKVVVGGTNDAELYYWKI